MEVSIAAIDVLDAEDIVREINLPAMQHGPLYRLMFPPWADMTEAQQNEIVQCVSKDLRKERERVLIGLDEVCRLTFMSVHPDHQRQGLGSKILEQVCSEIDRLGWPAFVMASPAGVRLYAKFGFDVVGRMETSEGAFTSMLRQSRHSVSGSDGCLGLVLNSNESPRDEI
ncbi:N-acetyltransferase domain-containing protein [Fusarium sp. Ph1]|nr:N-acetyltransferase domain-containing protein [Fusarium sp. Ph1]